MQVTRQQADDFGVDRRQGEEVTGVAADDDGFTVATDEDEHDADYVVLATGADRSLAEDLGCAADDDGVVEVGVEMETSVADAYATGAMVRAEEWQVVIAAGDGAAAALDILILSAISQSKYSPPRGGKYLETVTADSMSKEKGEHYHDFDVPADATETFGGMVDEA